MKKSFLIFALIAWPFLANAQEWVLKDSVSTRLTGLDIDTVLYVFPQGPLAKRMQSDTTKANVTAFQPSDFIRAAGDFTLWLDRTNVAGTPDSFKVWVKEIDPFTGRLAKNDSNFVVGSASTFGNFTSTSRYSITLSAAFGLGVVMRLADTSIDTVRVTTKLVYTQ